MKSGKGFIIPSDGRKEVFLHISALSNRDNQTVRPSVRVEFYRINGLNAPMAANIFLS
ncbi:TPA: cold shock domain-containing protein [Enterobacter hormaechei subsp. xiangfangensis]|nr:cold shock domain-containing protein [Enterobacter hormaechei subsp. xiangfangensis]